MENKSIWLKNVDVKPLEPLKENINVDVLIIGGGMTGMSTAYNLKDSELKVALVDRNLVGHGVTARSTAKITYLQELIYEKLLKTFSHKETKLYLESQIEAMMLLAKTIKENKIKCNYQKASSFVFTNDEKEILKIKVQKDFLESVGITVKESKKIPFNVKSKYAIEVKDTAVFNPVKYLLSLKEICVKKGIKIYENTKIVSVDKIRDKYICLTNKNKIIADKVVIACHYPFFLFPFFMPVKAYIEQSYISASRVEDIQDFSAITSKNPTKSIRYYSNATKKYLIYLNGSHNLCNKNDIENNFSNLVREVKSLGYKPDYIWSNGDLITSDSLPYIGSISNNQANLFIGTGYNTWGMTNGTIAGKIISDLILNKENKYSVLFSPTRSFNLAKITHFPLNLYSSAKSFIGNKLVKNKSWYNKNIIFKKIDGENVAIYKDENNKKHIVYNKCPHMKCSLIFNNVEKTWDCPCHASRFDIDGKCIKGPSRYNISYKKGNK